MLQRMSPATIVERALLFQSARKLNANRMVGSYQENVLTVASYLGTSHSKQYKKRLFLATLSIVHITALANCSQNLVTKKHFLVMNDGVIQARQERPLALPRRRKPSLVVLIGKPHAQMVQ